MNKEKFLELLRLPSRVRENHAIHEYIKHELDEIHVPYFVFEDTTIYNIANPTLPLFCAHTDTVRSPADDRKAETGIIETQTERREGIEPLTVILNPKSVLGGDDMCGVHILLEMLREGRLFNFIFSDGEETMHGSIMPFIREFKTEVSAMPFGIVIDRKGNNDIICANNRYGSIEFENALAVMGEPFGYFPETGMASDADFIRHVLSCANLSAGYYNAHTPKEFVIWEHMENAHNYAVAILDTIHEKFAINPAIFTKYWEDLLVDNQLQIMRMSGVLGYR